MSKKREIKFRAWDIISKQFVELWEQRYYELFLHTPDDKPYILSQFTGLLDKNGKEIYEGDILEALDGIRHVEEWDDVRSGWTDTQGYVEHWEHKVIGNIYENPEIIERIEERR